MWWRQPLLTLGAVVALVAALIVAVPDVHQASAQTTPVAATVETDPVPSDGDAADDPAVWVHPSDPSLSTVIGTDKEGGLAVYDLDGTEIQYLAGFRPNNVDVMHGFTLGGETVDLVLSSDRDDDVIAIHRIDPQTRQLTAVGSGIETNMSVYGICTYRSADGGIFVFVTPEDGGQVRQWELTDGGSAIGSSLVREMPIDSIAEGCVVDDQLSRLYIAEEQTGIWRYDADPDGGTGRVAVDSVGTRLDDDIEGLAIYRGPDGTGYLIASSQGSDEFVVYDREGDNPYVTTFAVAGGVIDEVTGTDGIEVVSVPLGPAFPTGMFIAQDGDNEPENQNFKLVPWQNIAQSTDPALSIEAGEGPRGEIVEIDPGDIPAPDPVDAVQGGRGWSTTSSVVSAATDDVVVGSEGTETVDGPLVFTEGQQVNLHFPELSVATGSLIRNAHVQFSSQSPDDSEVVLTFQALVGDQFTASTVTWAPAAWEEGSSGPYQASPDLSSIVREVVTGDDWESGDTLTLVVSATGPGSRAAMAFGEDDGVGARLTLEQATDR